MDAAAAGEQIILARAGKPVALLSPLPQSPPRRRGVLKGRIRIGADFDAPLCESILRSFEGDDRCAACLDTRVLLWWLSDDAALSAGANDFLQDSANELFVSAISVWEIAIKSRLGKVSADADEIRAALTPAGLQAIAFGVDDAAEVAKLPTHHRDPFDRALLAQAQCQGLRLLSSDDTLLQYGDRVMHLASLTQRPSP